MMSIWSRLTITIIGSIALASCGDIRTEFIIRSDSSATIRYTYEASSEIRDTAKVFRSILFSVDSALDALKSSGVIRRFKRSPILKKHYLVLDLEIVHYRQIDPVHRYLYSIIPDEGTRRITGLTKGMRDSIVFRTVAGAIEMQILNWIPDSTRAAAEVDEAIQGLERIGSALDTLALLRGGQDSIRAEERIANRKLRDKLLDGKASPSNRAFVERYAIPKRSYALNVPVVLDHGVSFSSMLEGNRATEAYWSNLHTDGYEAAEDFGKTPSARFSLRLPDKTDRAGWVQALSVCDECEQNFKRSGAPLPGMQFYTNKLDITYAIIDCGRDEIGKRTLIASYGYNDSAGNFGGAVRELVFESRSTSDTVTSWISDMLVGEVIFDPSAGELQTLHEVGKYGVRIIHDLTSPSLLKKSIDRKVNGQWIEHSFNSGKELFLGRENEHCANPEE